MRHHVAPRLATPHATGPHHPPATLARTARQPDDAHMTSARPGRWAAEIEGDFVVFLIGARPSRWRMLRAFKDLGGRRGMFHMLDVLSKDPDSGLLHYEVAGPFGACIVQYWRSFDHLERFATTPDPHRDAWQTYWRRVGRDNRSGIWHETFLVRAGEYEAIYANMPPRGLAVAGEMIPLAESRSARQRLKHRA